MYKTCKYCGIVPYDHVCPYAKKKTKYEQKDSEEAQFRNTRQWKSKSKEIRERDHYLCQVCLSKGILNYNNISVHHIEPVKDNEDLRLDNLNLITLCDKCHYEADHGRISKQLLCKLTKTSEEGNPPLP